MGSPVDSSSGSSRVEELPLRTQVIEVVDEYGVLLLAQVSFDVRGREVCRGQGSPAQPSPFA